jgi:hypothetical protein
VLGDVMDHLTVGTEVTKPDVVMVDHPLYLPRVRQNSSDAGKVPKSVVKFSLVS